MARFKRTALALFLASSISVGAGAGDATVWALPETDTAKIKFAPDRKIDLIKLALDVTPDFDKRTISGEATFTFKPIGKPLDELRLDGIDLTIYDVTSSATISGYQVADKEIIVTFSEPVPVGTESNLKIKYAAMKPAYGLYFRVPSNGFPEKDAHMFTQGEMIEARHWFPCYDFPNLKFKSEVTCHVPKDMVVLSNGRQVDQKTDENGLVAVHWVQDKPHVNYLISLVAGKFSKLEDKHRDIPLSFYTLPSDNAVAAAAFESTKPAMEFFEKEIGVPFPWAQYGQVVVHEFGQSGMENTTLTTLADYILHSPESENIYSWGGLYIPSMGGYKSEIMTSHELAHQWFGDLVTCKDWSHVWLNEGFATYYSLLFEGHYHGRDSMLYGLYQDQHFISNMKEDQRPIVYRQYSSPTEQFSMNRAYAKSAWVLHMLRSELGDDLFRKVVKTYVERFQYQTVVTEDLNAIVEELSGRSFDRFFEQWVYKAGLPELQVDYEWDEQEKMAKISVSQNQKIGDQINVMQFPLTVRFKWKTGYTDRRFEVKDQQEDFYVRLDHAPDIVRIDPEFTLLAGITFKPPTEMVYSQLVDKTDVVGRLIAADLLADKKDEKTISKLKECLNGDPFFGTRIEASESLRKIHSDEALDALIASVKQEDARVRSVVVQDIGKFFNPKAMNALLKSIETEKNPAIIGGALQGLAAYQTTAVKELFLKYLNSESFHNRLAECAIDGMKAQEDPGYIAPIKEAVLKREDVFTNYGIRHALEAIAYLARNEQSKDDVRKFITGYLNSKNERIQLSAISALGTLEDPQAIALLETFASSSKVNPQQEEAQRAINKIREAKRPHDNLKDLREQVSDLQKTQRELKKELEDLKKRAKADDNKPGSKTTSPDSSKTTKSVSAQKVKR